MFNTKSTVFLLAALLAFVLIFGCTTPPASDGNISSQGCQYNNPSCGFGYDCDNNLCVLKSGCQYSNPDCNADYDCVNNQCALKSGCQYNNASCKDDSDCIDNQCVLKAASSANSCVEQFVDLSKTDIFDSHTHITSKISASQIISEMDKAGVSMTLLYSGSSENASQYPGRFVTFVDTPPTWLTQGQTFTEFAEGQLKTGKFYGIGETNLWYYTFVNILPDNPFWLKLVDLSAKYNVPISFHFTPNDTVANAAFERMLNHNKDATLIWCHLGFNEIPLDRNILNDFFLRYPNLYLDTAGIQNMQNPLSEPNSNWSVIANTSGGGPGQAPDQQSSSSGQQSTQQTQPQGGEDNSNGGRLNEEWKQFFETWNSRILFGSDAGGGSNGLERWLNYSSNTIEDTTFDAIGQWKRLLSNLDYDAARNILSSNSRALFLKEQKVPYDYLVSSGGKCQHILVSSTSSVSDLAFNQSTGAITFTVADSSATNGSAAITIPAALALENFTALVDGKSVQIKEAAGSVSTTITVEYAGGIRTITIQGKKI